MKRPKPDANNCADCWEEECRGCEIYRNAAHFYDGEYPDETDETDETEPPEGDVQPA